MAASQSVEHPEKVSIGGDSVASSEYETVSMFEETGTPDQYKSTCIIMYYCSSSRNIFLCKICRQCIACTYTTHKSFL